jgi:hypothetical protein
MVSFVEVVPLSCHARKRLQRAARVGMVGRRNGYRAH